MCTSPNLMYKNISPTRRVRDNDKWHFRKFHPDQLKWLSDNPLVKAYLIPCGHCFECKMHYAKNWAIRLTKELEYSLNAYFLTITYNDLNLPSDNSLKKFEIKKFIKDIRNYCYYRYKTKDIKYFCCGEYGAKTIRPHYHMIIYNVPVEIVNEFVDLFPYYDENGKLKYTCISGSCGNKQLYSKLFEDLWNKGRITIDYVNFEACSYVARYIQKKQFGNEANIYDFLGIEKPFLIESKGIGKKWFLDHYKEIYEYDNIYVLKKDKVLSCKPPRYYDNLLKNIDLNLFEKTKTLRDKVSFNSMRSLSSLTDSEITYFYKNKEYSSKHKDKILVRK